MKGGKGGYRGDEKMGKERDKLVGTSLARRGVGGVCCIGIGFVFFYFFLLELL